MQNDYRNQLISWFFNHKNPYLANKLVKPRLKGSKSFIVISDRKSSGEEFGRENTYSSKEPSCNI